MSMRDFVLKELAEVLYKYEGRRNTEEERKKIADEVVEILSKGMKMFPDQPIHDLWEEISQSDEFMALSCRPNKTMH